MFFLLGVLLFSPLADSTVQLNPCAKLQKEAFSIQPREGVTTQEQWQWFLDKIREEKRCYTEEDSAIDPGSIGIKGAYLDEVWALYNLGRNEEALAVVHAFFERFDPSDNARWFGKMHWWRGHLRFLSGDLTESIPDFIQTLDFSTDWPRDDRPRLYLDLAFLLQEVRIFDTAQHFYQLADSVIQSYTTSTSRLREFKARSLNLQADLLIEKTEFLGYPDSSAYRETARLAAMSLDVSKHEGFHNLAVHALILLSEATGFLGDTEAARRYLDHADRLAPKVVNVPTVTAFLRRKQGRFFMQLGAYDHAQQSLVDALRFARSLSTQSADSERRIWRDLGHLAEVQEDYAQAAAYYRNAINVTEGFRESLRSTAWSAQAFADWQESHRSLVRVLLAQGLHTEAFNALEQTRARHLLDLRTQSRLRSTLSALERTRFDSLTTALVDVRNQLASETLSSARRIHLLAQEQQLIPARQRILNLDETFSAPPIDSLQRVLARRNQVLISYFLDARSISDRLFGRTPLPHAFMLTPDTLVAIPLPVPVDSVYALLAEVSPLLEQTNTSPSFSEVQFSLGALHKLYDRLVAPVAPYLSEDTRLVIIPDGRLFMLPFGMLVETPTAPFQYHDAPFLLRKHPVSVELAASLLLENTTTTAFPYDVAAFGKTDFSDAVPSGRLRSASVDTDNPLTFRVASLDAGQLFALPAVADELDRITSHFANKATFLNAQATEAAFLDHARQAKVLHVASHTLLNPASSLHNAIILSRDSTRQHDGILFLHEIQRQNLATQLVVLSGCSTARGVLHPGEGMAGLQYAFRAMGVQSSLATSWFVDDRATVRLMDAFYEHLQRGLPKDIALQQAQLRFLDETSAAASSPFFWAAPVLYGDTQPLSLKPNASLSTWVVWIFVAFSLLFVAYWTARVLRLRHSRAA
ncbi:MAG: CHAT domain-containing protein [Rhodothermales bacterium]